MIGTRDHSLEEKYKKISAVFERCEAWADEVSARIRKIEQVSEALFKEWQAELELYTSDSLRRSSSRKLNATKAHYKKLIAAMHRAESKIPPVLNVFRDQTLYLKHNLNASAIASLRHELGVIEGDVARLVREMESSIAEADAFLQTLSG